MGNGQPGTKGVRNEVRDFEPGNFQPEMTPLNITNEKMNNIYKSIVVLGKAIIPFILTSRPGNLRKGE